MQRAELKRAVYTFGGLLATFWIYATLIVPLIEPPVRRRAESADALPDQPTANAAARHQEDLAGLFAPDAWENQSPKVLRNRDTLLLFQDYHPQEDGTIHIKPCTVVLGRDNDSDTPDNSSALVLQAPEGAILQLSGPLDFRGAKLGKPVEGRLLGRIEIRSPGRSDGTGRLHVVTSNVHIDTKRLWTPNQVDFVYEQSRASGQDLMIKLVSTENTEDSDRRNGWAGIRSIELVKLNELHLHVVDDEPQAEPNAATIVDVACAGPLRVDFIENVMTLEDQVTLRRHNLDGQFDTLECQRLSLHLERQAVAPKQTITRGLRAPRDVNEALARHQAFKPPTSDASDSRPPLPKLALRRVVAEGSPAVLKAPSRHAYVRSQKLLYDLRLGRFRLWSNPDDPDDQVLMQHQQHEMYARELDVLLDETNQLSRVRAQGPGQFRGPLSEDNPQRLQATWHDALVFEREPTGLHHLTVAKQARVFLGQTEGIQADTLHLWLEPDPNAKHSQSDADSLSTASPSSQLALRPHRIVALADPDDPNNSPVRLRSKGVFGTTKRLDAQFVHAPPRPDLVTAPTIPQPMTRRRDAVDNAFTTRPVGLQASSVVRPAGDDSTRETHITGAALNVKLRMSGKEISLQELLLEDQVTLKQVSRDGSPGEMLAMQADTIRVKGNPADNTHVIRAEGRQNPVFIESDKMQLETPELMVDQQQNLVWSEHPGRMQVLVDQDAEGRPLANPQQVEVTWQGRMDFDGLKARFSQDVIVRSPDQRLRGEQLEITLNRKVAFGQREDRRPLDITQIRAQGNVSIDTRQRSETGQLTSIAYVRVPFVQINRATGDILSGGPGRVVTVRQGFGSGLALPGQTPSTVNRFADSIETQEAQLTFLQVDFQHQVTGNLNQRIVNFEDRVNVIYGPVLSWNEALSADAPLRKNDVLLSADRLTIAQGTLQAEGQTTMDLIAQGNAYVEGQSFTARGERISYEQAKSMLVLEGMGRSDAVLSHQSRVGAPRSETAARKIHYWTETGRVEVDDARYLDLSNLGN